MSGFFQWLKSGYYYYSGSVRKRGKNLEILKKIQFGGKFTKIWTKTTLFSGETHIFFKRIIFCVEKSLFPGKRIIFSVEKHISIGKTHFLQKNRFFCEKIFRTIWWWVTAANKQTYVRRIKSSAPLSKWMKIYYWSHLELSPLLYEMWITY